MFGRNKGHVLQAVVSWATYILIYFSSSAPWRFICLVFTPLFYILGQNMAVRNKERERERERERVDEHGTMSKIKKKKRMAMEINVRGPS